MATKAELFNKLGAEDKIKNKLITAAGQMFNEYEEKIDISNQILRGYENYNDDNKTNNDILEKMWR